MVKYEMLRLAVKYGLNDEREGLSTIRDTVYCMIMFAEKVQLQCLLCLYSLGSFYCFYVFCVHCLFVSVCCTLCVFNQ